MPDKQGWRKRIQHRPRDLNTTVEESTPTDDVNRRPPSWRGSTTSMLQQIEDTEASIEMSASRKAHKPKLARYLSGYRALKDASREPDFTEPWNEEVRMPYLPPVDPILALQSVYACMTSLPMRPIPTEHHSGLFRIFEDYRKVREEKERLGLLLHETLEGYGVEERSWTDAHAQYQAEIRRLELIIARGGPSGLVEVMTARRESVVERHRTHRKSIGTERLSQASDHLQSHCLDKQNRPRSKQAPLHHPPSPSGKMAALSRQFSSASFENDIAVGTPPGPGRGMTLSRKVKSELNLLDLQNANPLSSMPHSIDSEFSRTGDPLPDEIDPPLVDSEIQRDVSKALRELRALVAGKKGVDAEQILHTLTQLVTEAGSRTYEPSDPEQAGLNFQSNTVPRKVVTPDIRLRHVQSQPQLSSAKRHQRRHFSFEPGDDNHGFHGCQDMFSDSSVSDTTLETMESPQTEDYTAAQGSLNAEYQKPSKIPSPIQRPVFGSVRRENSTSSIITAFRENSGKFGQENVSPPGH